MHASPRYVDRERMGLVPARDDRIRRCAPKSRQPGHGRRAKQQCASRRPLEWCKAIEDIGVVVSGGAILSRLFYRQCNTRQPLEGGLQMTIARGHQQYALGSMRRYNTISDVVEAEPVPLRAHFGPQHTVDVVRYIDGLIDCRSGG